MICTGTWLVQRGSVSSVPVLASLPLGAAILAFLWINEFPDYRADLAAGKRNLVVRLGRPRASRVFAGLQACVYAGLALLPLAGLPAPVWLGALGLPFAADAARRLWADPETTARVVPAQRSALLAFVGLALGTGVGLWIG